MDEKSESRVEIICRNMREIVRRRPPSKLPAALSFEGIFDADCADFLIARRTLCSPAVVSKMIGISQKTLHRWILAGSFPAPLKLPRRVLRWQLFTVDRWIAERSARNV